MPHHRMLLGRIKMREETLLSMGPSNSYRGCPIGFDVRYCWSEFISHAHAAIAFIIINNAIN